MDFPTNLQIWVELSPELNYLILGFHLDCGISFHFMIWEPKSISKEQWLDFLYREGKISVNCPECEDEWTISNVKGIAIFQNEIADPELCEKHSGKLELNYNFRIPLSLIEKSLQEKIDLLFPA